MRAEWEPDELIDAWTLTGGDWDLIANKAGVTRLGFAVMLKFYERACDEDWCRILSQSLVLLLWAGHSGSGSSCHPWLVSQARSAVGWSGSCLRS